MSFVDIVKVQPGYMIDEILVIVSKTDYRFTQNHKMLAVKGHCDILVLS